MLFVLVVRLTPLFCVLAGTFNEHNNMLYTTVHTHFVAINCDNRETKYMQNPRVHNHQSLLIRQSFACSVYNYSVATGVLSNLSCHQFLS